jgi:hypothetical protein
LVFRLDARKFGHVILGVPFCRFRPKARILKCPEAIENDAQWSMNF